jgi:hypothetical protein
MPFSSGRNCLVVLLSLLLATAVVAPAQTSHVDLATYIANLQRWSAAVAELPAHPQKVEELRRSVPFKLEVETPGERFAVSDAWLVMALANWEKQASQRSALQQQMLQRLQWQLQQAQALSQPAEAPSSAAARARLAAVLSRREFRFVQPPTWWDLVWARIRRWFYNWLDKWFGRFHLKRSVSNVLSWSLLGSAFLLLLLMLWRNLRRVPRGMTRLGLQSPVSAAWGWRQWADAARAAAAEQRFRDAVHCCYWAAVFRLEEMGVWRMDDARTPREYLRLLPRDSQHSATMAALTRILETVWYGYRPVTPAEAESALQELERLACSLPSIAATASY